MRKLFLLIMTTIFLMACEGPMGPPGEDGYANWAVQFVTVSSNQWTRHTFTDTDDVYYEYTFVPDIYKTSNSSGRNWIYNDGSMMAYWVANYDTADEFQVPLYNGVYERYYDGDHFYESISFRYTANNVSFYLYYNDPSVTPSGNLTFRLVTNW